MSLHEEEDAVGTNASLNLQVVHEQTVVGADEIVIADQKIPPDWAYQQTIRPSSGSLVKHHLNTLLDLHHFGHLIIPTSANLSGAYGSSPLWTSHDSKEAQLSVVIIENPRPIVPLHTG